MVKCEAFPCNCNGLLEAKYMVTVANGKEYPMSRMCADMHIMAGYRSRKLTMGDVMSGKFASEADDGE